MDNKTTWDFCKVQRLINELGGFEYYPSFPKGCVNGDRLTQYGFDFGHKDTPNDAGVYAVVAFGYNEDVAPHIFGSEHLLYIGSSKNIRKRLFTPGHWYDRCYERLGGSIVYTRHLITNDYLHVEKSLIRTLRPLLNIHHNG